MTDDESRSLVEEGRARRAARAEAARRARTRTRVIAVAVVVLLAGGLWFVTHRPPAPRTTPAVTRGPAPSTSQSNSVSSGSAAGSMSVSAAGSSGATTSASATATPAVHSMTATEWADFVTEQYPGYRVQTRIDQPDQFNAGPAVNFLLIDRKHPGFRLFVTFAELEPGADFEQAPEQYLDMIGRVVSTDALFSAHAASKTSYLRQEGQEAIIKAYLPKAPSADAIVFSGFGDEGEVDFAIGTGSNAMIKAMASLESYTHRGIATIPHGPRNSVSRVKVVKR